MARSDLCIAFRKHIDKLLFFYHSYYSSSGKPIWQPKYSKTHTGCWSPKLLKTRGKFADLLFAELLCGPPTLAHTIICAQNKLYILKFKNGREHIRHTSIIKVSSIPLCITPTLHCNLIRKGCNPYLLVIPSFSHSFRRNSENIKKIRFSSATQVWSHILSHSH